MPIHDWTRVQAGTFHHFHQVAGWRRWDALNRRLLPPGYMHGGAGHRAADPGCRHIAGQRAEGGAGGGIAVGLQCAPPAPVIRKRSGSTTRTGRHRRRDSTWAREGRRHHRDRFSGQQGEPPCDPVVRRRRPILARVGYLLVVNLSSTPRDPQGIHGGSGELRRAEPPVRR